MKYTTDGAIQLTPREKFILEEATNIENSILYNDTPAGKINPEVTHALIGYASLVKDTDPSNAEDAVYLALEMFGDIENVDVHIRPATLDPEPDPTRP